MSSSQDNQSLEITAIFTYNAELMHSGDRDKGAKEWFFNNLLIEELIVHSNELGDEIGTMRVLAVKPKGTATQSTQQDSENCKNCHHCRARYGE